MRESGENEGPREGLNEGARDANGQQVAAARMKLPDSQQPAVVVEYPVEISIQTLMKAGAHFGHQAVRWNPKMLPYIFTERNKIHILNLDHTVRLWQRTRDFIVEQASRGANVLMVGTKQQAREIIREEAVRANTPYVVSRWLGGTLTNFETIKRSIDKMTKLEDVLNKALDENSGVKLKKKERLTIRRRLDNFEANLGGIRGLRRTPDIMFVVDTNREAIAVAEARRLGIPVIGVVDTNSDPSSVDFPIPSNDDSARAIRLLAAGVADAVIEGRSMLEARLQRQRDADKRDTRESSSAAAMVQVGA